MAKKKLSFRVAHSLAATGIVFAVGCEKQPPPNMNIAAPEQTAAQQPEEMPTVNTTDPSFNEPAAADAGTEADAGAPEPMPPG